MDKQSLRKEIKNKKRQFTSQELCELSFPVVMRLLSHPRIKTANTVMLYYSLPDEVDTHTLVDSLLMSGKHILLPRVTGEGTMELRRYTGPSDLAQGAYNIWNQQAKCLTTIPTSTLLLFQVLHSIKTATAWDAAKATTTACCLYLPIPTRLASASPSNW